MLINSNESANNKICVFGGKTPSRLVLQMKNQLMSANNVNYNLFFNFSNFQIIIAIKMTTAYSNTTN